MTQEAFAAAFRIPLATLRFGESPSGAPAGAPLLAIERDPKRMQRLLAEDAA